MELKAEKLKVTIRREAIAAREAVILGMMSRQLQAEIMELDDNTRKESIILSRPTVQDYTSVGQSRVRQWVATVDNDERES